MKETNALNKGYDQEILVVSFGTAAAESRRLNIGAVEKAISEAAGDSYIVRSCFTSQMIISIINKNENVRIDNISEALERAAGDGISTIIVQPTHLMNGLEYEKLNRILGEYDDLFENVALGDPLLTTDEDFSRVADALIQASSAYDDGDTALVFMGHGTEAASNGIYERLQNVFERKGKTKYYVGTVEAKPSVDDVISAVGMSDCSKVVIRPLMLVAGNHAVNDMSDPGNPESWYSRFAAAGYETECIIEGLGQIAAIRGIYVDHALRAANMLKRHLSQ